MYALKSYKNLNIGAAKAQITDQYLFSFFEHSPEPYNRGCVYNAAL